MSVEEVSADNEIKCDKCVWEIEEGTFERTFYEQVLS